MRFAANISTMFLELPFLERFGAAARCGFEAVECQSPYDFPKELLTERLAEHGLSIVLINLPSGDPQAGECGLSALPGREGEFQEGVGLGIEYALALGCERVNALSGVPPEGCEPERVDRSMRENLVYASRELERAGVRLMVEPRNTRDSPGNHVNTSAQVMALIEATGLDNLYLQYDFYHAQVMEGDLVRTFERCLPRIDHVQISDNPGRGAPGTGEIGYDYVLSRVRASGYAGWIGCEYTSAQDTPSTLGWMTPHL